MKSFLALSLFVGIALCNSTAFYGWIPQKEITFRFESETLTGIPEIDSQYSGLKLASDVKVQTFEDYSLRIKFENPRYIVVNQKLMSRDGRPLIPKPEQQLPEALRKHLVTPFLVHMKRGVVEELFVENDEPVVVTNIKKALLSQLQMDLSGSRRSEVVANHVPKKQTTQDEELSDITNYFSTFESTILGDCETKYTINPLPEYQAKELEERMRTSEKALFEEGIIAGERSEGYSICQGKKYWEVVKTKSFNNCKSMPVYQSASGIKLRCDFSKAECRDALTHTASTRYILCGSTSDEFVIRESISQNDILTNPLGWIASKEKMTSKSRVTLTLLNVKSSSSAMPKPTSSKVERSLEFQYPKHDLWSPTSSTRALTPGQENNAYGLESILPMPDLRSASSLFPSPMPVSELKSKVAYEMEKVVREIFKSPDSCSSRSDIAGSLSAISYYLRPLNYEDLKQVESSLHTSSLTPDQREISQELFLDVLAMTATNPAVMLVKEKIQREDLSPRVVAKVLQTIIRNVKTPTQQLLGELLGLVKSVESKKHIYNIGLIQLSNLVNKACINSDSQTSNFPVRIYGLFCKEDSEFITREYIPYLTQKLHQASEESEKLVIIAALGKIGHKDILLPLVHVIEDRSNPMTPMGRSVAVYMLKRLAQNEPSVKPILMALIDNAAESTEVRIAAVSVLPWAQPSTADLQKIASRTWLEPSKQVSSFIYSTLRNIITTEIPELKAIGRKAEGVLKTVKPLQYGIQFSKSVQSKQFIEYLRAASSMEASAVGSEFAYTPSKLSVTSRLIGASWEIDGLTLGVYSRGMDALIDSVWQKWGYQSEVSQQVQEQLNNIAQKLRIKKRGSESPASLIYFGMLGYDRVYSLDKEVYHQIISKVSEELRSSPDLFTSGRNFNYTHAKYAIELEAVGPSASGFAISTSRNVPFVAGIKGHVQAEGTLGQRSSVKAKIIPVINAKMQSNMGIISPFTKEFIGAGVETSLHMCTPLTIKSVMSRTGSVELSLQSPEEIEHQFEVLHAYVKPYTVRKKLETIESISKSPSAKPILTSGPEKHVKHVGDSVGLKGLLTIETDYPSPYFSNFWNVVKKHNFVSLVSIGFPSSVKYASFKLEFNPKESSTKKIDAVAHIVYGARMGENDEPSVHYPVDEDLSPKKEMEISETCRRRENSEEHVRQCEEVLRKRIIRNKEVRQSAINHIKETSSKVVSGVSLEATLTSVSSHRSFSSMILVSGEKQGSHMRGSGEIAFSAPSSPKYEVKFSGEADMPRIPYRWSIESLINQPIFLNSKFVTKYGPAGGSKKEIVLEANFAKTEGQKQSVKESTEMEKCKKELMKGRALSSICEEVRHQASSVNKLEVKLNYPREMQDSWLVEKVIYGTASRLFPLIHVESSSSSVESSNEEGKLHLSTEINRAGDIAQSWIQGPSFKIELRNITVPRTVKGLFPLSLRNGITTRLIQDISRNQAPASCRLDTHVSTFDNTTYEYQMNECPHLLFKDCSSFNRKSPIAVLAKQTSGGHKEVKILSSTSTIELGTRVSSSSDVIPVVIDGQEVSVSTSTPYYKKSPRTGMVILNIYRTEDGVVAVKNPVEGFELFFDGKKIEVIAPQSLRNRACGLCGDLNGENTADLKAPKECIMSSPKLAALTYLMPESSCPGIPSQYQEALQREQSECVKKEAIHTPLMGITRAVLMNKLKQESLVHVVEVQREQVCISKFPIKSCSSRSVPTKTKSEPVTFTCLVRTSSRAQQILKRVKSGDLIPEVKEMPTHFSRDQIIPTSCKPSSRWQTGQEQRPQHSGMVY